jgi:hypothetical protein
MLKPEEIVMRREALRLDIPTAARLARFPCPSRWERMERGWQSRVQGATLAAVAGVLRCRPEDLLVSPPSRRRA